MASRLKDSIAGLVGKARRPLLESIDESDTPTSPQRFDQEFLESKCTFISYP